MTITKDKFIAIKNGFRIAFSKIRILCSCTSIAVFAMLTSASHLRADDPSNDETHATAPEPANTEPSEQIPLGAPEPETSTEAAGEQTTEDEIAQIKASKTLHRFTLGSIQKQRMLAEVRKKAMQQGLSGQRLQTHLRGAKMVIDSVDREAIVIELKVDGKLLFAQNGRVKVLSYRVRGNTVEVQNNEGAFRRFAQFNGNKSTLSLLDPVYGKETVAVLQK